MIIPIILTVLVILIFLKMFVFNVYESKLTVIPEKEFYDVNEVISISVLELNGFGNKIPFSSHKNFQISVLEGEKNIQIKDSSNTKIISLKKAGITKLSFTTEKSLMPIYKEIKIK